MKNTANKIQDESLRWFGVRRSSLIPEWVTSLSCSSPFYYCLLSFAFCLTLFGFWCTDRLKFSLSTRSHTKRPFCYFLWLGQKVEMKAGSCVAFQSFIRQLWQRVETPAPIFHENNQFAPIFILLHPFLL